jgi:octaprenyl-diphosphate synthase
MSTVLPNPFTAIRPGADIFSPIRRDLAEVERVLTETLDNPRPCVTRLLAHLDHYRGKRLRPALLLLTARACGQISACHHVLGAVVEMIHTATLVHDDVLDEAAVRRHVPTVNAGWGNQASILLGDYLFTHAFHLASTVDAEACRIIGQATNLVCEGELDQVSQRGNLDLSEQEYLDIVDGKTAELTSCCCRLGALYSGAPAEVVESLARFGRWLGIAFQIADDLLDLVGEERVTGKSLGTDLELQKLTLPVIRLLSQAEPEDESGNRRNGETAVLADAFADSPSRRFAVSREGLQRILSRPQNHKREVLRPYLVESGAIEYAGRRAEEFAENARSELHCLPASECRAILEMLTDQVVHRNR